MKQLRVRPTYSSEVEQDDEPSAPRAVGIGLSEALRRVRAQQAPPPPPPAQQQGQVVVNVGGQGAGSAAVAMDTIDRLAAYVVAGGDFDRDMRLRNAVEILKASTDSEEERRVVAARLDEAVAVKSKQKEDNGGAWKAARSMFDKVAGILKGDD